MEKTVVKCICFVALIAGSSSFGLRSGVYWNRNPITGDVLEMRVTVHNAASLTVHSTDLSLFSGHYECTQYACSMTPGEPEQALPKCVINDRNEISFNFYYSSMSYSFVLRNAEPHAPAAAAARPGPFNLFHLPANHRYARCEAELFSFYTESGSLSHVTLLTGEGCPVGLADYKCSNVTCTVIGSNRDLLAPLFTLEISLNSIRLTRQNAYFGRQEDGSEARSAASYTFRRAQTGGAF